jgi:hypothetical protein
MNGDAESGNSTETDATAVAPVASVTVNQTSLGPALTDKILGMNMACWYDPTNSAIVPALRKAGIRALRWSGGALSDDYHWQSNSFCSGITFHPIDFRTFLDSIAKPGNFDVAIPVNYGSNPTCNSGGDPTEAAAWVTEALNNGNNVSHWTVGNEVFGDWETDLHSQKHNPTTYAQEVSSGYYPLMKAANPNALVGVVVQGGHSNWDAIVLAQAKYDFVEYHFYAQGPGSESDIFLVSQAAQQLTAEIDNIKADLAAAGHADTPIYLGELGSVYNLPPSNHPCNPGKQTSSITQALFAGQALCELMNAGVSRATWWLAFGGCSDARTGNFSSALYGWQNFGGYMVFSDGLPENGCADAPAVPTGILFPTARAYQLFGSVAQNGEHSLQSSVAGDTEDVRAYAATHGSGTVLVVFNLNQTQNKTITVGLSAQTTSSAVTIQTYDKEIYDQSQNNVWAEPTIRNLGTQDIPLTLTLTPWSMNVVTIQQRQRASP